MKHVAFIFTRGDSWASKLIRLQTWGEVNHTAFEFVENNAVIQIQSPKIVVIPREELIGKASAAFRFVFEVNDDVYASTLEWAMANIVGKAYDKVSIMRFLIPLRGLLGRLKPAVRSASETWFCSEGSEVLGRKCGKGLLRETREVARISPQDQFDSVRLDQAPITEEYEKGILLPKSQTSNSLGLLASVRMST